MPPEIDARLPRQAISADNRGRLRCNKRYHTMRSAVFYPVSALLIATAILLRVIGLPFQTHDMQDFLLPWFDYIVTHGRWAALSDNFYNYTPPYIYAMTLVSYLDGAVSRVALIKSISILFDLIAAGLVYRLALAASPDRQRAVLFALLFLNLPTLILNGAWWGQCDIIYTAFILAFAYAVIKQKPLLAMAMYGIALSLKVQAIFAAPFVLYLLLSGFMPWAAAVMPPLVYGALILPAALAGRGWISLLTIYAGQAGIANKLSARAPNIYVAIQHFLAPDFYPVATLIGIGVAGMVSLIVLVTHFRRRPPFAPAFVIAALALWLALEPSLLPKMHDRYFFGADIFAFALIMFVPKSWWVAALFQVGSVLAYSYFMMLDRDSPFDLHPAAMIGALAAIPATIGLGYYYRNALRAAPDRP